MPLPALACKQISANALRVAATWGRLQASKAADGTWRSTRAWVEEYLAGRYEREAGTACKTWAATRVEGNRMRGVFN